MHPTSQARVRILSRIAELDVELRRVRAELKNLAKNDPATPDVVLRGARLSRERSGLERRLEVLRLDPTQLPNQSPCGYAGSR